MQTSYSDINNFLGSYYTADFRLLDTAVQAGCSFELWAAQHPEGEIATEFVVLLPVRSGFQVRLSPLQQLLVAKDKPVPDMFAGALEGQAVVNFRRITSHLAAAASTGDLRFLADTFTNILQRSDGFEYRILTEIDGLEVLGEWATPAVIR